MNTLKIRRSTTMILLISLVAGISMIMISPTISEPQSEQKTFVTHSGSVIQTSGEVIDPLYVESTLEFDPMNYLRDFDMAQHLHCLMAQL